jgi:hypothetical protein
MVRARAHLHQSFAGFCSGLDVASIPVVRLIAGKIQDAGPVMVRNSALRQVQ